MIDAIVYKGGILRRSWKFKFVAANGRKLGHQYNDPQSAIEAVRTLTSNNIGVRLRVQNEHTGLLEDKGRIQRFRDAGGEKFLLQGWGYELMICRLADLIDRGHEDVADKLACDEGASGNQWDCAKALAAGRIKHGDEFAAAVPAGLSPISGSADYS